MTDTHTQEIPKRRGRPPNGPVDIFRVKAWFWSVAGNLRVISAYKVEKYFEPEKFTYNKDNYSTSRPCKYDKYKRGKHEPEPELVERIEEEFPGTKKWLTHALWDLLKNPTMEFNQLYPLLIKLRPSVSDLLFHRSLKKQLMPSRRDMTINALLDKLDQESNIDALIACIGLLIEAKQYARDYVYYLTARTTVRLFFRVFAQYPLYYITPGVFEYLRQIYFDNDFDPKWTDYIQKMDPSIPLQINNFLILLIEDLGILKKHGLAPLACLYYTDKHLTPKIIADMYRYNWDGDWDSIRKLPEIKKLTRCLRRWESKKEVTELA